jgi:hypothetical protein
MSILPAAPIAPASLVRIVAPAIKRHLTRYTVSWASCRRSASLLPQSSRDEAQWSSDCRQAQDCQGLGPSDRRLLAADRGLCRSNAIDIVQVAVGCVAERPPVGNTTVSAAAIGRSQSKQNLAWGWPSQIGHGCHLMAAGFGSGQWRSTPGVCAAVTPATWVFRAVGSELGPKIGPDPACKIFIHPHKRDKRFSRLARLAAKRPFGTPFGCPVCHPLLRTLVLFDKTGADSHASTGLAHAQWFHSTLPRSTEARPESGQRQVACNRSIAAPSPPPGSPSARPGNSESRTSGLVDHPPAWHLHQQPSNGFVNPTPSREH